MFDQEKQPFQLADQIRRSGTSIGANLEEALGGLSRKDFIAKCGISYKEARETLYWLRLLRDTDYIDATQADSY
ncbi:four helix bundle protein [Hymenobacter sp. DG25B]|uniref:four helix bundle protein n=1 Tax=Hymenobacter sp. DG25B TaxID=1385664 RepID=UPI0029346A08|nr:four helix bundle protein [Hymenobacter sp. DG25B]